MYLHHVSVCAGLDLLSPLHIGCGREDKSDTVTTEVSERRPDDRVPVEVSLVLRDHDGRPCLPATTLKGALRARLADAALAADAFGVVSDRPTAAAAATGRMGRLWLRTATLERRADAQAAGLPYLDRGQHQAVFVKAQTRIARDRGTADRHKLFQAEMVPPGSRFTLSLRWLTDRDWTGTTEAEAGRSDETAAAAEAEAVAQEIETLATLLAPLATADGVSLGRGTRQGQGRIRLDPSSLEVRFHTLGTPDVPDDRSLGARLTAALTAAARDVDDAAAASETTLRWTLHLRCHGPFLIQGAAQPKPDRSTAQGGDDRNIIRALTAGAPAKPVLWPSSLLGALRERASWLAELDRLRRSRADAAEPTPYAPSHRAADAPLDDRDLDHALPESGAVRRAADASAALSSVERLFGVAGWRGRVAVETLTCTRSDPPIQIHSVTIDRFTGGALESRLFGTEATPDPEFTVTLRLDTAALPPPDRTLFEAVLDEIAAKGLFLGHGASKGYGWFAVTLTERPPAQPTETPA